MLTNFCMEPSSIIMQTLTFMTEMNCHSWPAITVQHSRLSNTAAATVAPTPPRLQPPLLPTTNIMQLWMRFFVRSPLQEHVQFYWLLTSWVSSAFISLSFSFYILLSHFFPIFPCFSPSHSLCIFHISECYFCFTILCI